MIHMKRNLWIVAALLVPVVASGATSATVRKDGAGGAYTTIQAAINSGASTITITDSGNYVEDLQIGDTGTNGPPVVLTSTNTGNNRPVITPASGNFYENTRRANQTAGFGLLANNSSVSNLIIEALAPAAGAMMVMADNVLIENCLFRISTNTTATLGSFSPLLFFSQEGSGGVTVPGGRDCNGCIVRNCEFFGMAPDAVPVEPTGTGYDGDGNPNGSQGYLGARSGELGTGQNSGYARFDHYSDGRHVFITFEGCYFHHSLDYGIFPSDYGPVAGAGSINLVARKCWFDATSKFEMRGRGANIYAESCVFTRCHQLRNDNSENSAVAIQSNGVQVPSGSVSNCLFVNCGSANAQRAYYGGVNNNNGNLLTVDHCTFVDCLTGVGAGSGGSGTLAVSNSIFHQIGYNVPPSVDANGITLTNGSPELVGGLYPAWTNGLVNFGASKWSAVFNRFNWNNSAQIIINNCMVGDIASEDLRSWDQAAIVDDTVLGCRLFAGYDTNFVGAGTVTRATPVFVNTDPAAPNAFQLAQGSPGQGLGADLAPVLEPKLGFSQAGNQITISWTQPLWMTGYALMSASSLSLPHSWNPVAGVSSFGVAYTVAVTVGAGNQFFALIKQ